MRLLFSKFTDHPRAVGETYIAHFLTAASFACLLTSLAMAALVHAIFPFLFEKTVSRKICELAERMSARHSG